MVVTAVGVGAVAATAATVAVAPAVALVGVVAEASVVVEKDASLGVCSASTKWNPGQFYPLKRKM